VPGPGGYRPDPTEGISRVDDPPKPNASPLAALPVAESVALGLRLKRQPIDRGRVLEILATLGISSKAGKPPGTPGTLSGSQI